MREDALRLVAEDTALGARRFGNSYFELSCRGKPALLVDNSLEKLVIVLYAGGEIDAPCDIPISRPRYWRQGSTRPLTCLGLRKRTDPDQLISGLQCS